MGVDHIITYDCRVKQALGGPEELVRLIKGRSHTHAIMDSMREKGENTPPAEVTFKRQLMTPDGVRTEDVNLQQLIDETTVLDAHAPACAGCPANASASPFGCCGYVNYPIRKIEEEWLMGRLPESLESTAGKFLTKAVADLRFDGAPVARLRRQGRYFELTSPVKRRWGGLFRGVTFTSDQMLHMMWFTGPLQPSHCALLCLFFGLAPHELDPQHLAAMMENLGRREAVIQPVAIDHELAPYVRNMIHFLNALRAAAILDAPMEIDA